MINNIPDDLIKAAAGILSTKEPEQLDEAAPKKANLSFSDQVTQNSKQKSGGGVKITSTLYDWAGKKFGTGKSYTMTNKTTAIADNFITIHRKKGTMGTETITVTPFGDYVMVHKTDGTNEGTSKEFYLVQGVLKEEQEHIKEAKKITFTSIDDPDFTAIFYPDKQEYAIMKAGKKIRTVHSFSQVKPYLGKKYDQVQESEELDEQSTFEQLDESLEAIAALGGYVLGSLLVMFYVEWKSGMLASDIKTAKDKLKGVITSLKAIPAFRKLKNDEEFVKFINDSVKKVPSSGQDVYMRNKQKEAIERIKKIVGEKDSETIIKLLNKAKSLKEGYSAQDFTDKVINEESPPSEKWKKWLEDEKVQKSFKDQYGERWKEVMFAKAWKGYNDEKGE